MLCSNKLISYISDVSDMKRNRNNLKKDWSDNTVRMNFLMRYFHSIICV